MNDKGGKGSRENSEIPEKKTSMEALVTWNVSKALENNPNIDLRDAMRVAQKRLEESHDLSSMLSQSPEERHLACALLAWQQLGHCSADSLYSFVSFDQNEKNNLHKAVQNCDSLFCATNRTDASFGSRNIAVQNHSMARLWRLSEPAGSGASLAIGPVIKLPVEPQIVMRLDNQQTCRQPCRKMPDMKSKIDAACCLDSACVERLSTMDKETNDLRTRACRLAKREAERVELLERAETAWHDLEAGYQRRLRMAEEKEEDIENQIAKVIQERNGFKAACMKMVAELKIKSDLAEKERTKLTLVEKEVCGRACERGKLGEQAARGDALLAEHLCKAAQLDRELMFKEEQARRKQLALEGEADAAQALTHEAERAIRAELAALKEQVEQVARDLLTTDTDTARLKEELEGLRQERNGLLEDLEGCQIACEGRMKSMMDDLKNKREELAALKLKEMDCRCKMPMDASVEAKRTPSLAALCNCSPEEKLVETCSCTSLRSRLLSDLLADLFTGLQSELWGTNSQMPCHLLKCLEDKHNWDRASAVKTSLRSFFSKLLLGELDIAIATSIEKYHAKWVGASCADEARTILPTDSKHSIGWQARALELKAQKMATQLADQLFKEKAKELAQQAKTILAKTGRPPCECHPTCCTSPPEVYPCLVKPPYTRTAPLPKYDSESPPKYLRRTLQDVTQLRMQIEDLKKDTIKREDLNRMEEKIAQMVQFASTTSPVTSLMNTENKTFSVKKDLKINRFVNTCSSSRNNASISKTVNKRKQTENNIYLRKSNKATSNQYGTNVCNKLVKRPSQQFAVNLCLYDAKKKTSTQSKKNPQLAITSTFSCKQSISRDNVTKQTSSVKEVQPSIPTLPQTSFVNDLKASPLPSCREDCACFHKKPSNISINKLLETLTKWKEDLVEFPEKQSTERKQEFCKSLIKLSQKSSKAAKNHSEEVDKYVLDNLESTKENSKNVSPTRDLENSVLTENHGNYCTNAIIATELPVVTESEYMGAINLEKSADNSCKCENNGKDTTLSNKYNIKFPFKCINSEKCICKECLSAPIHHEQIEQGLDTQSFLFKKFFPIETRTIYDRNVEFSKLGNKSINNEIGDVIKSSFNDILKCNAEPMTDYDDHIKCLGVTLTNITSKKLSTAKLNQMEINIEEVSHHDILKPKNSHRHPNYKQSKSKAKKDLHEMCNLSKRNKESALITSPYIQHRNTHGSVNKSEKAQNLNKSAVLRDEPCICCQTKITDDSKDLEVNTFQLLEEHLKGKLQDFKNSFCKSSCIPNAEEEKIFTAILQRIKQLISESTSTVTCKCKGNSEVSGSWNRAYTLLQEYLRTKIERVKCHCNTVKNNEDANVLPNVLNNISYLIENDFQRLKKICKCRNSNNFYEKEYNANNQGDLKSFALDMNNSQIKKPLPYEDDHVPTSDKDDSAEFLQDSMLVDLKNPVLLNHNISAQVSLYHSMDTKSCDAIQTDSKYTEVQTVDNQRKTLNVDGYNNVKSTCDCCSNYGNKVNNMQYSDLVIQNNEIPIVARPFREADTHLFPVTANNKKNDITMDAEQFFDEQSADITNKGCKVSLPYIGYTMNCCCDSKLGCVCTKSTVRALNDRQKIKDIWKTFTNQESVFNNVSYMFDNAPVPKEVNYAEVTGGFYKKSLPEVKLNHVSKSNVCDSKIDAYYKSDINLKKSKENVLLTHETTNTVKHYRNSKSDYSVDGSLKRRDKILTPNRRKSERVSIIKQNKVFDLYLPEDILVRHDSATALNNNSVKATDSMSTNCDCKMVPICHVKMLVANIEDKLANAQCTCDSLSSKVCPVHSLRASH